MASKKQLKKDINNSVGALIEEIYVWELMNPKGDFKKMIAPYDSHGHLCGFPNEGG